MRHAPCREVTPGLCVLWSILSTQLSQEMVKPTAGMGHGYLRLRNRLLTEVFDAYFTHWNQSEWSWIFYHRSWWEMKLNGTRMLGGLVLWCLAGRRHLEDRFRLLCEILQDHLLFMSVFNAWKLLYFYPFFILLPVLHPAPNQLAQSMPDGVRVTFSRPSRPPNIPSPPPLIPTTKPTDKPSFIQGGSISQVKQQGWNWSTGDPSRPFYMTVLHTSVQPSVFLLSSI